MNDTDSKLKSPPYLSFTTFRNFVDSMKEGIPARIDKTMMRSHSGSTQNYLLSSLRFFDLIAEDGTPKDLLEEYVNSSGEERTKTWKTIFEPPYKPILGNLPLEKATLGQLFEKFTPLGLTGDTLRKCVAFFAAGADAAGIAISPHLKNTSRGATGIKRSRKTRANGSKEDLIEPLIPQDPPLPDGHLQAILPLDKSGVRYFKLEAPSIISSSELARIQQWLSFQLIVEDHL